MNSSGKAKAEWYISQKHSPITMCSHQSQSLFPGNAIRQQDPIQKLQKKKKKKSFFLYKWRSFTQAPSALLSLFLHIPNSSNSLVQSIVKFVFEIVFPPRSDFWDSEIKTHKRVAFLEKFLDMGVESLFWTGKESKEGKKYQLKFHGASLWLNPTEKLWSNVSLR